MRRILRDAVAVAVVSGLVFQSLRRWVGEHYVVPSNSMQPTLYGDAERGDVVFVDKLARASALRRYDLAVFHHIGEDGADIVKRVVAFGGEWVEPRNGDLWVGPSQQQLERLEKDPLADRDLRVPWLRWPGSDLQRFAAGSAGQGLVLPVLADEPAARAACTEEARREQAGGSGGSGSWWATTQTIDLAYIDACGRRGNDTSDLLMRDFGADFDLDPTAGVEQLLCAIDLRPDRWVLAWRPASGEVQLWRNGETRASGRVDPVAVPPRSAPVRVEFGHLDGRFFLALDGRRDSMWVVPVPAEWHTPDPGPTAWPLPGNQLSLAVIGQKPVRVDRLELFHDVHWYRQPMAVGAEPTANKAVHVPAGEVYLLGDNAADSRDSRMFGPVPLTEFVGRPRAVLGPWARRRLLPR